MYTSLPTYIDVPLPNAAPLVGVSGTRRPYTEIIITFREM